MPHIASTPFDGQKPGTSGLRKQVKIFTQTHYLENFVQSLFDSVPELSGGLLVIGGDGRFYNDSAIQIILRMAAANGVAKCLVGQNGLLSTPAASCLIRKYGAQGGLILSASHNPGGPDGDFGIKFNGANGGPAPERVTNAIYARSQIITGYDIANAANIELGQIGHTQIGDMAVQIIDPVRDYADLLESLFDFGKIRAMIANGFTLTFDAMHAVTGPYAKEILQSRLGAPIGSVKNATPLPDFGGGHPDPNRVYAKELFETMFSKDAPDFGAASDGDGDRNIVLGKGVAIAPSDSLAIITANAHLAPAYQDGISGVARSMPTSRAADVVAKALGVPAFETPTGWKFFGNLLDSGQITICGEESAGTGSSHVREKDGLWAVLMWLNILAQRGQSMAEIQAQHFTKYGRHYYCRHDYEAIDSTLAAQIMADIDAALPRLIGRAFDDEIVSAADNFTYHDPVDGSSSDNQGLRILFKSGSRIVFRLSGTGTVGATLRIYLERYEADKTLLGLNTDKALTTLIEAAEIICQVKARSGKSKPDMIT